MNEMDSQDKLPWTTSSIQMLELMRHEESASNIQRTAEQSHEKWEGKSKKDLQKL